MVRETGENILPELSSIIVHWRAGWQRSVAQNSTWWVWECTKEDGVMRWSGGAGAKNVTWHQQSQKTDLQHLSHYRFSQPMVKSVIQYPKPEADRQHHYRPSSSTLTRPLLSPISLPSRVMSISPVSIVYSHQWVGNVVYQRHGDVRLSADPVDRRSARRRSAVLRLQPLVLLLCETNWYNAGTR